MPIWTLLHMQSPKNTTAGQRGLVRELTQASSRSLKFSSVAPDEVSFTLPGNSIQTAQLQPLRDDVLAFRDSACVQRFRVVSRVLSKDSGVLTAQFSAVSYRALLDAWLIHTWNTRSYASATEQTAIAWDLVATAQGRASSSWNMDRGPNPTLSTNRTLVGQSAAPYATTGYFDIGQKIGDAVKNLAELTNGFEYAIIPRPGSEYTALRMMFWTVQDGGRNQYKAMPNGRSPFILDDGGALASWTHTYTPEYANVIRASGSSPTTANFTTGDASGQVWAPSTENPVELFGEGRWEREVTDLDLTTGASVTAAATAKLAELKNPVAELAVSLTRGRWMGPSQLWLGDRARLIITERVAGSTNPSDYVLYVDEDVTVVEINVSVDDQGAEDVSLSLNRPALSTAADARNVNDRLVKLERR